MTGWDREPDQDGGFFGRAPSPGRQHAARSDRTTPSSAPSPSPTRSPTRRRARSAGRRASTRPIGTAGRESSLRREPAPVARIGGGRRLGPGGRSRRRPADVDPVKADERSAVRLTFFAGLAVSLFGVVVLRLVDVQFTQRDFWLEHGLSARTTTEILHVERGSVYDRNGNVLAMSVYRPNVVADPTEIEDDEAMAAELAPILGVPEADLAEKFAATNQYQLLARNVSEEVREALRTDDRATPEGIYYEYGAVREYPADDLSKAIVGHVYRFDQVDEEGSSGRSGIERRFDVELRGEPGAMTYEKNGHGGHIAGRPVAINQPRPGLDVHLTIDQDLQHVTREALTTRLEELDAEEATALVMRPSTGEVLAMMTVAVDEKGAVKPTSEPRAATRIFESGSVVKPITIAAAMEAGQIGPDTQRRVPDSIRIYDKTFTDHSPHPVQHWTTTDILSNSSNVGTIQIAQGLGADELDRQMRSFGFGSPTGADIDREVGGLFPDVDDWSGTSLGSIAIGQTVAVTPLQLISAYNVIANGGLYVAPHVVGSTDDGDGRRTADAPAARRVISGTVASQVEAMLAKVVSDGTGRQAAVPGYSAFGKTGTARIPQDRPTDPTDAYLNEDGGYDYASTFVGGVRGADLTILVMIREPKHDTSGSAAAAPVFSQLAAHALRSLAIPPQIAGADPMAPIPELSSTALEDVAGDPASTVVEAQG